MTYKATVNVTLKKSVLDPQGKTVLHALEAMGLNQATDVRVGKYFGLKLDAAGEKEAGDHVRTMCDRLLINPVIEDYTYKLEKL